MVKTEPCETTKPVEGESYVYQGRDPRFTPAATAGLWIYHCEAPPVPSFLVPLEPIQRAATFVSPDYSNSRNLLSNLNAQQSTVYWQHLLCTQDNGETDVYFFTNDLTGRFACILQGLSAEGPIYGQTSYTVIP